MRIDEVGQLFDLDLEHADVDSVSGLVLMLLGRPPRVGDVVEFGRLRFDVTAVRGAASTRPRSACFRRSRAGSCGGGEGGIRSL
jgi:CBS domain containing-hemolysin-like protein